MRGLCVKIWSAVAPISPARIAALSAPPAVPRCAPKSIARWYRDGWGPTAVATRLGRRVRSRRPHAAQPDRVVPRRERAHHALQLALRAPHGRPRRAAVRGHRPGHGRPRRRSRQAEDVLRWLGIDWDEGPHRQTQRLDLYAAAAAELVESGAAYRATAPPRSSRPSGSGARRRACRSIYSGRCREPDRPSERAAREARGCRTCIRLAMPADGTSAIDDVVRGRVEWDNALLGDHVIFRSDGTPTYLFANPFDDIAMGITHVIRGEDLLPSTPRQLAVYAALDAEPPTYAHLPMVLGTDKKKLSKRHGAVSVEEFRDRGVLSRGARQLPRARRVELRRPHDDDDRPRAGRAVHARAGELEPRRVRSREARVAERRAPAGAPARRASRRRSSGTSRARARRLRSRAGAGGRGGARSSRRSCARWASSRGSPDSCSARPSSIPTHGRGSRPTPPRRGGSPRRATRSPGWRRGGPRRSTPRSPPHARRRA